MLGTDDPIIICLDKTILKTRDDNMTGGQCQCAVQCTGMLILQNDLIEAIHCQGLFGCDKGGPIPQPIFTYWTQAL